jgi:glycerophosphoryl diester phosphodiesterase
VEQRKQVGIAILVGAFCAIILALPLATAPFNSNVISGPLPPRPLIFAHRGGGYIGPENTLQGDEAMAQFGVIGTDLDIRISSDGVPFLCHDDTFYRTTNIAQVFPGRENKPCDNFTIAEIEQLDAGSWFLSTPNAAIAAEYVNQSTLDSYRGAKVETLAAVISFCEQYNWFVDCDFKGVSPDNPYASQYMNITLGMLLNSSISHFYIAEQLNITDPRITYYSLNYTSTPMSLLSQGYTLLQIEDLTQPPSVFQRFTSAGFPVYYQFADDAVAYSAAWCLGCKYVISDAPFLLYQMTQPIWYVPSFAWYLGWIAIESIFVGLVVRRANLL